MRTAPPARTVLGLVSLVSLAALSGMAGCGRLKPANADDTGGSGGGGSSGSTGTAGSGAGGTIVGTGGATGGRTLLTVSGTMAPHPLEALTGVTTDFSQLKVSIVDPTALIADPNASPLASTTLDTSTGNCSGALGCAFSLSGVDITNLTLGLVGTLEDKRTGDARLWIKTGTGMGTAAFLTAERASKTPITDRHGFIVSRALEAKLVPFVNLALGTTLAAGDLEARGFLIGHVLDKLSTGNPIPAGVAGATVSAQGNFDVIYPNATFTGKGTATSSTGIFLMVPRLADGGAPMAVVTNWSVIPPAGDPRTWEQHLAGTNPGNAFVIIMPADETPDAGVTD